MSRGIQNSTSSINAASAGSSLTNDGTIEGVGLVNVNLTNDASGVVNATTYILSVNGYNVANAGLMKASDAAGVYGLDLENGKLDNTVGGTTNSGRIDAGHSNSFFYNETVIGGTLSSASDGWFQAGASVFDGSQPGGAMTIAAGTTVELQGLQTLTIKGLVTLSTGSTLTEDSGAVMTVDGTLALVNGTVAGAGAIADGAHLTGFGHIGLAVNGADTITADNGTMFMNGAVDQSGVATTFNVINYGRVEFLNAVGSSGAAPLVNFQDQHGAVEYAWTAGAAHFGQISGFSGQDAFALTAFGAGDTLSKSGYSATISNGAQTETLTFANGTAMGDIQLAYNSSTGLDTLTICFMPGTLIATPAGEVAVETLKPGDLVLTSAGEAKPVNWVGRQSVARRFSDPLRNWPVRVKAGALADNVPSHDLLLSPDHALFIDGAMFQAGALVNGTSIVRETDVPEGWTYYHIELDDHSLILAEGAPAETFVDNVDRMGFDNWDEFEALYPEGKAVVELPYPRAKAWRQVPKRIREALAARAATLGYAMAAAA